MPIELPRIVPLIVIIGVVSVLTILSVRPAQQHHSRVSLHHHPTVSINDTLNMAGAGYQGACFLFAECGRIWAGL